MRIPQHTLVKTSGVSLVVALVAALAITPFQAGAQAARGKFDGAKPAPMGPSAEPVAQLQIRFPEAMVKEANKEAFKVACSPAVEGFSSWADNNTTWTFDFKAKSEWESPRLAGGTKCRVEQITDVKAASGKMWKAGTISYDVIASGPNVVSVTPAHGFKGSLRETDPVLLITFDGPVDAARFFSEQNGSLNYLSSNAPSEKMALQAVPAEQAEKIFAHFKMNDYSEVNFEDRTWVLATVKQSLIPGSQVNLTIEKQASADNADVRAAGKFTHEYTVRSQFQAEIQCASPSAKNGNCLPGSPISIALNGMVKWADLKDAYIEYVPFKSDDGKTVRSFAEIDPDRQIGFWDNVVFVLARYFPWMAKYSDLVLDSVVFNVKVEPQTQAKIVLPQGLVDIDGRLLSNVLTEFHVRIGAMSEVLHTPKQLSFFEKKVANPYLPVSVVNLNQTLKIRRSGKEAQSWEPIRDFPQMITLVRAYARLGTYRDQREWTSPLETLGVASNLVDQKLTGVKNRPTVLQFPFGRQDAQVGTEKESGLYVIEVSSPTLEAARSDSKNDEYYNPKAVLAQVTDLTVHLKKGATSTLAWVTRLNDARPVASARLEIYNCLGELKATYTTDAQGLVSFANQKWADDCRRGDDEYTGYGNEESFFAGVREANDFALVHSSWTSSNSYALGAPGVEWFNTNVYEGRPNFHAVIGVNLVKPGQRVPIELHARIPDATGFSAVAPEHLPKVAQVASYDDEDTYYEFPLTWVNGKAEIVWNVPGDSAVRLGSYSIQLKGTPADPRANHYVESGDIEVAEFKIPLMSGIIAFPNEQLVRPDVIPVNSVIRYANGVGAKKLKAELSYYFATTSIENKDLLSFTFGSGALSLDGDKKSPIEGVLPTSARPAVLQALETGDDGSLVKDIAKEPVKDGRSIAEVLKQADRPQRLVVRVRYQDQMGEFQTLSQAKDVFNAKTYLGTNLIGGDRSAARLQVAAVDVDSSVVTSLSDLELKVVRIETRVIGEELFGGLIKNTLEREVKPVRWVSAACSVQDKVVSCPVGALKDGSYAFEAKSKSTGQAAHSLFKVATDGRVYGPSDYYNFGDDEGSRQLPLALDKKSYTDGDRAVVSFAAPFKSCQALVTIERSDVTSWFLAPQACEKGQIEVPINASLAPNAFVSVYAITGRADSKNLAVGESDLGRPTYRLGFANLKVNWSRFRSNVVVKTNKEKYEPGETVEALVSVKADEGQLQGTTVTLVALEEKILELKKNDTYKVLEALMQMRGHDVETVTALERIETVMVDNVDEPKEERKGGDEGGDGSSAAEFKRKLFDALVAFQTNVPVVNGVAKISFKTNDSLTRFKVFAIATDVGHKFGTGEAVYLTEKDTQAYSNIPLVAHSGDAYPVRVTVQNNSAKAQKFKVVVKTLVRDRDGKVIGETTYEKEQPVDKSGSESITAGQITVADNAGQIEYEIRIYDENGKLVDVMEPPAQVILPSVPLAIHDSLIAQVENGSLTKSLVKDPSALQGQGEIRVTASTSLVASALAQIDQRLDRDTFADFFIESRFNRALARSSETKPEELKSVLDSLMSSTDSAGFLKYHPRARSGSLWLTAHVLNSLQLEPWSLKLVPPALSQKLKGAVSSVLTKSVPPTYVGPTPLDWMRAQTIMARAAFTFDDRLLIESAKALNASITEQLKRNPKAFGPTVDKWSNNDLAERWLLEVFATPEKAAASSILESLVAPSRLVLTGNMAKLKGAPSYASFYSDETLETAKLLLGLSRITGDKNQARRLAVGLVASNVKGWYNSATMIHTAHALKAFGRAYETQAVTGTALVSIPEQQKSGSIDFAQKPSGSFTTPWTAPTATVKVTHGGQGNPWVGVQALSAIPLNAPRGQGLSIEKTIKNLNRDSDYQAGDIIEVTLTVHANNSLQHVALMDPIPAGANILAEAYGDYSSGQKSYSGYKLYFEWLANGVTTVKYQYQLNNPGSFRLPPTRAEGLYLPSVFAEAPNAALKVK